MTQVLASGRKLFPRRFGKKKYWDFFYRTAFIAQ
jgi:hypothetical protein